MNEDIMRAAGFGNEVDAVKVGKCPFCGADITENSFRDALSKREYRISGLCQKCQDQMFGDLVR